MIAEQKHWLIMLVLLFVLVFIYHLGHGFYYAGGLQPSPRFDSLFIAGFLCGVVWSLRGDTKRSPVVSVYCTGLLVSLGMHFLVPYHLFKTRGAAGLLPLLAYLGVAVAGNLVGTGIYFFLSN